MKSKIQAVIKTSKPLKNGTKRARGGRREGAGRPPKAATILRKRIIQDHVAEAEASFAFLVAVRDNEQEPSSLRVECAKQILDRVLGKPAQPISQDKDFVFRVIFEDGPANRAGDPPAETA